MRFLITFFFFLLGCSAIWFLVVWGQAGRPTKMSQWSYDAYKKKQRIAQSISGKKIVIVAGSNALFGIDSKIIANTFNMPVVNYGVNAGIELPLTLLMAQKGIEKGDIVIMPLEYPMYTYNGATGAQMIDFLLARESHYFMELSFKEQFYTLWHITFKRVYEGYFQTYNKPIKKGLYGAHHIDRYGDQIKTDIKYRSNSMYKNMLKNHMDKPETYGAEFSKKSLSWFYLEKFMNWCNEKEVKVIFMPSTLLKDKSYFTDRNEKWFYSHIANEIRSKGWDYVGNPYDYMYHKELYFNTNYHLLNSARKMRTEKMIQDLIKSNILK